LYRTPHGSHTFTEFHVSLSTACSATSRLRIEEPVFPDRFGRSYCGKIRLETDRLCLTREAIIPPGSSLPVCDYTFRRPFGLVRLKTNSYELDYSLSTME